MDIVNIIDKSIRLNPDSETLTNIKMYQLRRRNWSNRYFIEAKYFDYPLLDKVNLSSIKAKTFDNGGMKGILVTAKNTQSALEKLNGIGILKDMEYVIPETDKQTISHFAVIAAKESKKNRNLSNDDFLKEVEYNKSRILNLIR